jgi:hypothetical protein
VSASTAISIVGYFFIIMGKCVNMCLFQTKLSTGDVLGLLSIPALLVSEMTPQVRHGWWYINKVHRRLPVCLFSLKMFYRSTTIPSGHTQFNRDMFLHARARFESNTNTRFSTTVHILGWLCILADTHSGNRLRYTPLSLSTGNARPNHR